MHHEFGTYVGPTLGPKLRREERALNLGPVSPLIVIVYIALIKLLQVDKKSECYFVAANICSFIVFLVL